MAWMGSLSTSQGQQSKEGIASEGIATNARNTGVGNYNPTAINNMGGPGASALVQGGIQSNLQQQQAGQTSDLSRQNAGQDLLAGHQQGAFQVLNTLLSRGYISEAQRDAAMKHYGSVLEGTGAAKDIAGGLANNGLFTDEQRAEFRGSFNPAMDSALDIAKTGGFSEDEWGALMGDYSDLKTRNRAISDEGILGDGLLEKILSGSRQDMLRAGKGAVEAAFNGAAGNATSPFGGVALNQKVMTDTGANIAKERSELNKYNADSRMKANTELREAIDSQAGTQSKRAETRLGGVNAAKGMTDVLSGFLEKDAGGKTQGLSALIELLGLEGGLAGEMAGLETQTDPGGENMGIVDQLLGDLGEMVNVKGKKNGGSQVKTAYGKNSTGQGSSRGTLGGGGGSGFMTGTGGFRT